MNYAVKLLILILLLLFTGCHITTKAHLKEQYHPDELTYAKVNLPTHKRLSCGQYAVFHTRYHYQKDMHKSINEPVIWIFEIASKLKESGFVTIQHKGTLQTLIDNIKNNRLSILFLRGSKFQKFGHFIVLHGYNLEKGTISYYDQDGLHQMRLYTFLNYWKKGKQGLLTVTDR